MASKKQKPKADSALAERPSSKGPLEMQSVEGGAPSDRNPLVMTIPSEWLVSNAQSNKKRLQRERALPSNSHERIMAIDVKIRQLDSYISWSKKQPGGLSVMALYIADDPISRL